MRSGERRYPWWQLIAAAVGASLLAVVAVSRWGAPSDEHAYWLAARRLLDGEPLYDAAATIVTPFAYLYPPPLAQMLVPIVAIVPAPLFSGIWTAAMCLALWWLSGRDVIKALALVAFLPVAVELWFRNVHLFLAVLIVLGLRTSAAWFALGAAIKILPGLGIPFLLLRGRWREATVATAVGVAMLVVSYGFSPAEWGAYLRLLASFDPMQQSAFIPIAFPFRAFGALVLVTVAARLRGRQGDMILVAAMTLALPSLWFTGLSLLVAVVPLYRAPTQLERPIE